MILFNGGELAALTLNLSRAGIGTSEGSLPSARWRYARAFAFALLATQLLTGCFGAARERIAIRTYQIDYDPPEIAGATLPVVLQVAPFRIAAAYDRQAIIYRDSRYATDAYFYHRWAAHPAKMLSDLIARDLAQSRRYQAVQQGASLLVGDYVLQGEVEQIEEISADSACAAHLRLQVTVSRLRARETPVTLQNAYSADGACPCNAPSALAEAMSRATATISKQLQTELANAISNDLATKHR